MSGARSPEEIRESIEAHRADLALSVDSLRQELTRTTDWRARIQFVLPRLVLISPLWAIIR